MENLGSNTDAVHQATQKVTIGSPSTPGRSEVLIVGAGPAGLTAARQLQRAGIECRVVEKDSVVGGISRTVSHNGYHFDIGGHRFFTKVKVVDDFWHDVLKDEFLVRSRTSRILYNRKFFNYPLKPVNALFGLGIWVSFLVFLSYIRAHLFPIRNERSFEDWVVNRFGLRLYNIFFKTYTEKVWGTPCNQISAEWAAQRIKGLSLKTALINAMVGDRSKSKQDVIKTLIDTFHYPKRGPGMMWEKVARDLGESGHNIHMNTEVTKLFWSDSGIKAVEVFSNGNTQTFATSHCISTMPIRELVEKLDPAPPSEVTRAAKNLKYRDFLTVAVVVNQENLFPDNWIYIHDDSVKVGRVQNFKNWSPYMVPDPSKTCLGLEYFCFEGDGLWNMPDEDLVTLAKNELQSLGLVKKLDIEDGTVVRMPKAYPVYDNEYSESLQTVRRFLDKITNLQLVGRNGMHKYNNQDHSMLTAMLAVENIQGARHDLWSVNAEQDYHEEVTAKEAERIDEYSALSSTQPMVPETLLDEVVAKSFARLDKAALATAIGTVAGTLLFLATFWQSFRYGPDAGDQMELLAQYFYGYTVTYKGAIIGFIYAFLWGFTFGWLFAYLRNLMLGIYVHFIAHKARSSSVKRVLDYI